MGFRKDALLKSPIAAPRGRCTIAQGTSPGLESIEQKRALKARGKFIIMYGQQYVTLPFQVQGGGTFLEFFSRACTLGYRTPLFQSSKRIILNFYEGIKTKKLRARTN